ncbi:MAG TPA: DUF1259 domain-containing protein [Bacteroidota bacterium]|nr:DUF1259 domain-containing protein [Bacteroidota bacterium]
MKFACVIAVTLMFMGMTRPVRAQEIPQRYRDVLSELGKKGDYKDRVLKVGLPRNDLKVTVAGVETPTPFGFGGWVAMTSGGHGMEVMMGDLVLLQEEVNPVMSALLDNGLEVTALHNHFFWDEPHIYYMHVHGHGRATELARKLKPALGFLGKELPPETKQKNMQLNASQTEMRLDTSLIAGVVKHKGERNGSVYKITIGRDDIRLREMGALINARMGLNSWAAFTGSNDSAAVAGDIAMLEGEVTPVLKALRAHALNVVAIHHHMTGSRPMIIFLHYWGTGHADQLAAGFKAAIDQTGIRRAQRTRHSMQHR